MKRIVCCMIVCFFILSGVALAQERGVPKGGMNLPRGKWWRMPEVAKDIGISADEQVKLDDVFYKHRNRAVDLKSTVRKEQLQLERLIEKETVGPSPVSLPEGTANRFLNEERNEDR